HRRDELRASKIMAERGLANEKIEFIWNSEVTAINGDAKVESVDLHNVVDDTTSTLDVNGVFIAIGSDLRTNLVQQQLDIIEVDGTIVFQEPSTNTTFSVVFASVDVVDGKYLQAISVDGMGV